MASQIITMLSNCISTSFGFFAQLLESTGLTSFFLTMFSLFITVTYLVSPFIQEAKSDMARADIKHLKKERKGK